MDSRTIFDVVLVIITLFAVGCLRYYQVRHDRMAQELADRPVAPPCPSFFAGVVDGPHTVVQTYYADTGRAVIVDHTVGVKEPMTEPLPRRQPGLGLGGFPQR